MAEDTHSRGKKPSKTTIEKRKTNNPAGNPESLPSRLNTKQEDIQRIGATVFKWYGLPPAKTDEEIAERLHYFFKTCIETGEPMTIEKMSLALGYDRTTIYNWSVGKEGSTPTRKRLIRNAKEILASFDADMAVEGKINPVVYMFRAKNYFGLKDQQEHVITPNNPLGEIKDTEELQQQIIERLPGEEEDEEESDY